jgi:ABC-2 type transport system permease protein
MSEPEVAHQAAEAPSLGRGRRFVALVRKESFQIVRDPSSILIAFVLPIILLFIFGYGVSLDATRTRVGLVVESATPVTQSLAASFQASTYFDVINGHDRREFEQDLVVGRVHGIIVIPSTFAGDYAASDAPKIEVIVDGSDPNTASFVQSYAQGVVAAWTGLNGAESTGGVPIITVNQRFWFNAELISRNFLVPGAIAIVMTLVGTLLTSLVIAREWERGTMEAMMATPVTAAELLAGKILPYFILAWRR